MISAKVELTQALKQQRQFVALTGSGHNLLLDDAAGGTGPKPIELTLLTATELELLVRTSAPSWYQRWSKPSFSALEESSQGNIQGRHATGTGTALLS